MWEKPQRLRCEYRSAGISTPGYVVELSASVPLVQSQLSGNAGTGLRSGNCPTKVWFQRSRCTSSKQTIAKMGPHDLRHGQCLVREVEYCQQKIHLLGKEPDKRCILKLQPLYRCACGCNLLLAPQASLTRDAGVAGVSQLCCVRCDRLSMGAPGLHFSNRTSCTSKCPQLSSSI